MAKLLPLGSKACIIITTRSSAHITSGNAGERYLELLHMDAEEAKMLLISAAEEPRPWPASVVGPASALCDALGFQPLALVQAAKIILTGYASGQSTWRSTSTTSNTSGTLSVEGVGATRGSDELETMVTTTTTTTTIA